jgi:hypothetical protein
MACWNKGADGFTYSSQNAGILKKHAIGPTVNRGPQSQQYIIKANIVSGFSIRGVRYVWADFKGCNFDNETPSSEADWREAWSLGKYTPSSTVIDTANDPFAGSLTDPFAGTQTLLDAANSFTNSDNTTRNLIIAAVAIGILTLVITINVK